MEKVKPNTERSLVGKISKKLKKIFKTIAVKLYFNGVCVSPIQRSREEKTEESMLKNKEKAITCK